VGLLRFGVGCEALELPRGRVVELCRGTAGRPVRRRGRLFGVLGAGACRRTTVVVRG